MTTTEAGTILDLPRDSVSRLYRQGHLKGRRRKVRQVYHVKQGGKTVAITREIVAIDLDGTSVRQLKKARNRG